MTVLKRATFLALVFGLYLYPAHGVAGSVNALGKPPNPAGNCSLSSLRAPHLPGPGSHPVITGGYATSASDVWLVGYHDGSTRNSTRLLAIHWDGKRWRQLPASSTDRATSHLPSIQILAVSATSAHDMWAGGSYGTVYTDASTHPLIEHWNGSSWSLVNLKQIVRSGTITTISALHWNDVWAAGSNGNKALILHWNGAHWSASRFPGLTGVQLLDVRAITSRDVWAVGTQTRSRTGARTAALSWNGRQWREIPSPNPGRASSTLDTISGSRPGDVWAGGAFDWTGRFEGYPLLEHWNGSRWSVKPAPKGRGWIASLLAVSGSQLWQVERDQSFDLPLPPTSTLRRWNGTTWSSIAVTPARYSDFETLIRVPRDGVWLVGQKADQTKIFSSPRWQPLVERIEC